MEMGHRLTTGHTGILVVVDTSYLYFNRTQQQIECEKNLLVCVTPSQPKRRNVFMQERVNHTLTQTTHNLEHSYCPRDGLQSNFYRNAYHYHVASQWLLVV